MVVAEDAKGALTFNDGHKSYGMTVKDGKDGAAATISFARSTYKRVQP